MKMKPSLPAKTFLNRYLNKVDNRIHLEEIGLNLQNAKPESDFIKDFSNLSETDFLAVSEFMDQDVIRTYLYNKYPNFFGHWDRGRKISSSGFHGKLDGYLDELEVSAIGGIDVLIKDVETKIQDQKDRLLLQKIAWIKETQASIKLSTALSKDASQLVPGVFASPKQSQTADEFLKKYSIYWKNTDRKKESEFLWSMLKKKLPNSGFVQDLSSLSNFEFKQAIAKLGPTAIKVYLYNKYPSFFEVWDNGYTQVGKRTAIYERYRMDGLITALEIQYVGDLSSMISNFKKAIKERRDRLLAVQYPILADVESDELFRNKVLHKEHEDELRELLTPLMPGSFSTDSEEYGCIHGFKTAKHDRYEWFSRTYSNDLRKADYFNKLEIRTTVIQKFWLKFVRRKSETSFQYDQEITLADYDKGFAIYTNSDESAKSFLSNTEVIRQFETLNIILRTFEITRGRITMTICEPELSFFGANHVMEAIEALRKIISMYEHGSHIRIAVALNAASCPFCRELMESQGSILVKCASCGTQLHQACWTENNRCTTWGCESTVGVPTN
jgi:hypothetical protein